MVNESGQLYTIEGFAAALLLVFTIYLILGGTNILTPGDTHINDMQIEQLGNDVLAVMDINETYGTGDAYEAKKSPLESYVMTNSSGPGYFRNKFNKTVNEQYDGSDTRPLSFSADVWYRSVTNTIAYYHFADSRKVTGTENAVKVSRWVHLSGKPTGLGSPENLAMRDAPQSVLFEVTLWRD